MSRRLWMIIALAWAALADGVSAQGLTALARVDADRSFVQDAAHGVDLTLSLSQPVPYRVFTLDAPRRLVLDFSEVAWDGVTPQGFDRSDSVTEIGHGDVATGLVAHGAGAGRAVGRSLGRHGHRRPGSGVGAAGAGDGRGICGGDRRAGQRVLFAA